MCSDCYQVSYEFIFSSLAKETVPILYLPWWDTFYVCIICKAELSSGSIDQKWCSYCFIVYSGCRYCLTTNIIFGFTDQSQCKKCRKVTSITIFNTMIDIGYNVIDDFIYEKRNIIDKGNNAEYMKDINKYDDKPLNVYDFFKENLCTKFAPKTKIEWIPHYRIKNLIRIAEGGYSVIYQATWLDGGLYGAEYSSCYRKKNEVIVIKRFKDYINGQKHFLNELKSHYQCYNGSNGSDYIIRCYGIVKDPVTNEYMLAIQYANGGDLHNYLRDDFKNITWKEKLEIIQQVSIGLEDIHNVDFIHRDLHSGNILLTNLYQKKLWQIGDLGLSQHVNNTSSNNEIYGVIPYIAPEIFKGSAFSKESDVYCMGMIMWELTTGCKPFANVEHDHKLIYKIVDGVRPKITEDTPKCFASLMESCWNADPKKRPPITEVCEILKPWYNEKV
ncbi:kinase-like domain-containing protein, partial [Glomus cerebriforme]